MGASSPCIGRVVISRGARVAEANLLGALRERVGGRPSDLDSLRVPIRVVVPSRSLREHLSARLVESCGRAVAGVAIQTLSAVVASILERSGEAAPVDDALFAVSIRQLAREVVALREPLEALRNGYSAVEADVADLLDAGFEPVHAEALIERIADLSSGTFAARAASLVRVAAEASERIETTGMGHGSLQLRRARELLEADPEAALPAREVFVFGFADATGVQTDFIESLVRWRGARVYIDRPPDPSEPHSPGAGMEFTRRFEARLTAVAGEARSGPFEASEPPRVEVIRAPNREAEVRAVADRVRQCLDAGMPPERIGVVARNLDGYRNLLRVHFGRLGVPQSGIAELGPAGPLARRTNAVLALLRLGRQGHTDTWLDAILALPGSPGGHPVALNESHRAELRHALRRRGIVRLEGVASLDPREPDARMLQTRPSGSAGGTRSGEPPTRRRALAAAGEAARALVDQLDARPRRGPLRDHLDALFRLLVEPLGWHVEAELPAELGDLVGAAVRSDFTLDREDFQLYLERRLAGAGRVPIGGRGGGVQVLSAMEARSRSFDRLFAIGMSRGVFPRPVREDPLLPDALRRGLRALLPDLPVKREGVDEERFLFAQLLSSSPVVVASYPAAGDGGRSLAISPLLGRLDGASRTSAPALWEPRVGAARPAFEYAVLAGLHGSPTQRLLALRAATAEADADAGMDAVDLPDADLRARVREAVVSEWEGRAAGDRELGPYYGFAGELREATDPRRKPLSITTLEKLVACPWQAFLGELLRIGEPPGASEDLPSVEPRVLGKLVHHALQEIAAAHLPSDPAPVASLMQRGAIGIPWPGPAELEALLMRHAEQLLREEGIATPGFAGLLASRARGMVEAAGRDGWPGPHSGAGVLGVEVDGEVAIRDAQGGERQIRFRADRLDRAGDRLRWVDYKTGAVVACQLSEERRRQALHRQIASGAALQTAAYAVAGAQLGSRSEGQYRHLRPDVPDHARVSAVDSEDSELIDAFFDSAGAAVDAIDRGSFFPRLVEPTGGSEPRRCRSCRVKSACLRGDSGAKRRLERWLASGSGARSGPAQRALLRLWKLGGAQS